MSEPDVEERVSGDSRLHVGRWTHGGARGAGSTGNVWQEWGVGPPGLLAWLGDPPPVPSGRPFTVLVCSAGRC